MTEHSEDVMPPPGRSMRYALPIPDDWDGETWTCCPLVYPDSPQWAAIIRGLLQHLVRGRTWDETTGSVADVQHTARLMAWVFNPSQAAGLLPQMEDIMNQCMEPFVQTITHLVRQNVIVDVVEASCCADIDQQDEVPSPVVPGQGDPPGGFDTWSEYNGVRCQAAQAMVDNYIDGANIMAGYGGVGAGLILAIVAVIATVVRVVIGVIAALLPIVAQLFQGGSLEDFAQRIDSYREELICALYSGGSHSSTKQAWYEAVNEGPFNAAEKVWMNVIMQYTNINNLIDATPGVDVSGYQITMCTNCEDPPSQDYHVHVERGTPTGDGYYNSQLSGGSHFVTISIWETPARLVRAEAEYTVSDDSRFCSAFPAQEVYRIFDKADVMVFGENCVYPVSVCGHVISIKHQGFFTVRVLTGQECT